MEILTLMYLNGLLAFIVTVIYLGYRHDKLLLKKIEDEIKEIK